MAGGDGLWMRIRRLGDALALGHVVLVGFLVALLMVPALAGIGVIFVAPVLVAVIVRLMRELYFAATGRELRSALLGDSEIVPPAYLGISPSRPARSTTGGPETPGR
jgi:hypothetical protein